MTVEAPAVGKDSGEGSEPRPQMGVGASCRAPVLRRARGSLPLSPPLLVVTRSGDAIPRIEVPLSTEGDSLVRVTDGRRTASGPGNAWPRRWIARSSRRRTVVAPRHAGAVLEPVTASERRLRRSPSTNCSIRSSSPAFSSRRLLLGDPTGRAPPRRSASPRSRRATARGRRSVLPCSSAISASVCRRAPREARSRSGRDTRPRR